MSVDPAINAALLNMCAQVQDSANNAAGNASTTTAPASSTLALAPSAANTNAGTTASNANTQGSVAASSNTPAARPASDYEWLRNALASVESPEKKVKQLLFQMEDKTPEGKAGPIDAEDRLEALEELSDMVEDVNWAAEFTLMEGPQRVLRVLSQERRTHPLTIVSDPIPSAASTATVTTLEEEGETGEVTLRSIPLYTQLAMIIAHSAQLNEPVQAVYQSAHWEAVVLRLVRDTVKAAQSTLGDLSTSDEQATEKATANATKLLKLLAAFLHACSCLCRECPANTIQFIQHGGLAVLADALKLTRAVVAGTTSAAETTTTTPNVPVAVTTIHNPNSHHTDNSHDVPQEQPSHTERPPSLNTVDVAPLVGSANKVTARVFFFAAYLASTGVSSEDIMQLTCQHAEENDDATVQKAAARELLELVAKSPKATKEAVHAHMPRRFYEWKSQLQHVAGEEAENHKDERQAFVEALDASN